MSSSERGGRQRPLVHRDAEDLEDHPAERDVDGREKDLHYRSPTARAEPDGLSFRGGRGRTCSSPCLPCSITEIR